MTEQTSYTFEDCIKKCESIIDGIYQDGYQSIHLYSLKTFIYGMVDIHNKTTIELQDEVNQFRAIGTIEEFKALKEKNTPYKPKEYEDRYYACKCDNILLPKWKKYPTILMPKSEGLPHCMACGQKLDWSK